MAGPPNEDGWDPSVILFSPAKLQRWIVEASGLEPVDALDTTLSDETLSVQRDLLSFLNAAKQVTHPTQKIGIYPNLILYHEGYLFCSVHLALRKPYSGWGTANRWAAPDSATRDEVMAGKHAAVAALAAPVGQGIAEFFTPPAITPPVNDLSPRIAELEVLQASASSRVAELEALITALHLSTSSAADAAVEGDPDTVPLSRLRPPQ